MTTSVDAAIIEDVDDWQRGLWAAVAAIEAARRTGDRGFLDQLEIALGIESDPATRGAWEAVCIALIEPPSHHPSLSDRQ